MIALATAILRSFVRDRVTFVLALLSPAVFFSLFALFYRHLDSPQGVHFDVVIVARDDGDAKKFVDAFTHSPDARLTFTHVHDAGQLASESPRRFDAQISLGDDFSRDNPTIEIVSLSPFPGMNNALRALVQSAAAQAFAVENPTVTIVDRTTSGALLRSATASIPVLFILFAISSLVGRGLADEESGLADRFCSLGLSRPRQAIARIYALSAIAFVQMVITFLVAGLFFGIVARAPISLVIVALTGSIAISGFMVTLAGLCRSHARFAIVAPVATLVLGAIGGGIVPLLIILLSFSTEDFQLF